jgi:lipoate-protein ligase A
VTGIAAHRNRGATLVHGTLLVDADLEALTACIDHLVEHHADSLARG